MGHASPVMVNDHNCRLGKKLKKKKTIMPAAAINLNSRIEGNIGIVLHVKAGKSHVLNRLQKTIPKTDKWPGNAT